MALFDLSAGAVGCQFVFIQGMFICMDEAQKDWLLSNGISYLTLKVCHEKSKTVEK
jgi:hypothetical protein